MLKNWIFLKQETDQLIKLQAQGKFVFNIHPQVKKQEIKEWITQSLGIPVLSVNTQCLAKKKKRRGRHIAYPIRYKTIIVTIDPQILKTGLLKETYNTNNILESTMVPEIIDTQNINYDINIINF